MNTNTSIFDTVKLADIPMYFPPSLIYVAIAPLLLQLVCQQPGCWFDSQVPETCKIRLQNCKMSFIIIKKGWTSDSYSNDLFATNVAPIIGMGITYRTNCIDPIFGETRLNVKDL